jgi:SNF2 family DNA or RNA helicase
VLQPYDFQVRAVQKLRWYENRLIGDDMGLGKTIEAILLDKIAREGALWPARTLVLTYGEAMVDAWADHFADWNPSLKVIKINRKDRGTFSYAAVQGTHDVYIMHWEALRLMPELSKINWLHIIADEVQKIKNRKAQVTTCLKSMKTKYKTAMSGTAADNNPQDLWSPLNWLWPKQWSSYNAYERKHVKVRYHNAGGPTYDNCQACLLLDKVTMHKQAYKEVCGVAAVEELHEKIDPYYIRRTKEEVLKDLPEKYYTYLKVKLTPQQRKAYDQMAEHMLSWIGTHEDEPVAAPVVIAQLIRLQQFGVAYGELVKVRRKIPSSDPPEYEMVDTLKLTDPSSKLDAVMEIVEANPNESIVVFAQSKQVINLLGQRLDKAKISHGLLTGDTSQGSRGGLVKDFQSGKLRVFAGTISAGGVGITLTRASTVIFVDRAWSPSANSQAEDRLHRIGQKSAVQVIILEAENTIDRVRNAKIQLKWSWLKELLGDKPQEQKIRPMPGGKK